MVAQALELARKPHVVIATPGRLADHLRSSSTFSLRKIKFLVSLIPSLGKSPFPGKTPFIPWLKPQFGDVSVAGRKTGVS